MRAHSIRTLALMARVARVREVQAQQMLAEVIAQKDIQLGHTRQVQARAERSDSALHGAIHGPVVDLPRLPLLQELSSHLQATLVDEREQLHEREQEVLKQTGSAGKQSRYRERIEEKAMSAHAGLQQVQEARQHELATEAWLIRQTTETA